MMKILINTVSTKKNAGGAFQIAYNFLMKSLEHQEIEWVYVVSSDLDAILPDEVKSGENYHVFTTQPDFKGSFRRVKRELRVLEQSMAPDVVYSVTAPSYFSFHTPEVMRFTNPWVTHPNKYSWKALPLKNKIRQWLYCWNQRRMMKQAKYFVTQTETTKRGIVRITGVPEKNVRVVNNVLPGIFKSLQREPKIKEGEWIDIACVGAPVPHKNFEIIPNILKCLREKGLERVRFQVTIPKDTACWKRIVRELEKMGLRDRVITHGRCSQTELASLYRHCQLCLLPTLLEVFSASTLEAMYFRLPIVATDFDFNREVMADSALYYTPMLAENAAEKIVQIISDKELQVSLIDKMEERLALYGNYDKHFDDILDFIMKVGRGEI